MARKKRGIDLDSIISEHEAYESRISRNVRGEDTQQSKELIGTVEQFFEKISVAAIRLQGSLKVGDIIEIGTEEEAVRQKVASMQIDRKDVEEAFAGDSVGIKSKYKVDIGSPVYRTVR
ncbi:MAG: translation elongation factor-like protein [Candidatus Micrarchaeia archaeon]